MDRLGVTITFEPDTVPQLSVNELRWKRIDSITNFHNQSKLFSGTFQFSDRLRILPSSETTMPVTSQRIQSNTVREIPALDIRKNLIRSPSIRRRTCDKTSRAKSSKTVRSERSACSMRKPSGCRTRWDIGGMRLSESECAVRLDVNLLATRNINIPEI
jgi:hypothetical protein